VIKQNDKKRKKLAIITDIDDGNRVI